VFREIDHPLLHYRSQAVIMTGVFTDILVCVTGTHLSCCEMPRPIYTLGILWPRPIHTPSGQIIPHDINHDLNSGERYTQELFNFSTNYRGLGFVR